MPPSSFALVGGALFLLSFWHFVVDWGFQSHREAMAKSSNALVRARHCTVYTVGMALLLMPLLSWGQWGFSLAVLWGSHFLIDTYLPVYMWARFLRKPPELSGGLPGDGLSRFKDFARTPIGLLLMISMDQALHILFLVPSAILIVIPGYFTQVVCGTVAALLFLGWSVLLGYDDIRATW